MKKLYYTIAKETNDVGGGFQECTGNKTVVVYDIINNEPEQILYLELELSDNSEDNILDELDEEIYPNVELVLL